MQLQQVRDLLAYTRWANHRTLDAAASLSPEQYLKDLGSSFRSVRDTLFHIYGVEWIWLERLEGRSPKAIPSAADYSDVAALRAPWAEVESRYEDYLGALSQAELEAVLNYTTLSYGPASNPRWEILVHVANHGTYHRGQASTLFRQLGAKGPATDIILYFRERTAAAGA